MLSRTTRLFKTLSTQSLIRSYGSAPKSSGGAYPGVPGPDAKTMQVEISNGDAIYSYKHQNFVVDPNQIDEAAEHMQTLINADKHHHHHHGPNCNHDHHDDHHHDDHHDDHHHHVDPDQVEDAMPRGFFLNRPPGVKQPIPNSVLLSVLAPSIIVALIASYVFERDTNEDLDRFRENYYRENPELKELVDKVTKKQYPLSH